MDAELLLIDKVELRIALAATALQFEAAIKVYLSPLLLKLASPHAPVRQQILQTIQHLVTRINAYPEIQLPVSALMAQVKAPSVPAGADAYTVRIYSLLFISRGIDRMSPLEMTEFLPELVKGISLFTQPVVAARIFSCVCKILVAVTPPQQASIEAHALRAAFVFDDTPEDESLLCGWLTKLFLLQPAPGDKSYPCPGLLATDVAFLTQDAGVSFTSDLLTEYKRQILAFVACGCFKDSEIQTLVVIATVDGSSSINDLADTVIRKLSIGYESRALISSLFALFLGNATQPAVKPTLQARILAVLCQSKLAAHHPDVSRVSSIGLNSDYTRLKQNTVLFVKWVAQSIGEIDDPFYVSIAAQLKQNLLAEGWPQMDTSVVKNYSGAIAQRRSQYEALGSILKRQPGLLQELSLLYLGFLFDSLAGDTAELRLTIQDSLSGLTVHLPGLPAPLKAQLKTMLGDYLITASGDADALSSLRYVAIKYVNCAFSFDDAEARMLCIFGCSSQNRADIIEEASKGLHPYWFNILQSSNTTEFRSTPALLGSQNTLGFPRFVEMVDVLLASKHALRFAMDRAVEFVVRSLVMEAIQGRTTVVVPDQEWEIRVDKALEFDETVNGLLRVRLNEDDPMDGLSLELALFLSLIVDEFTLTANVFQGSNASFGRIFTKLASLVPDATVAMFLPDITRFEAVRRATTLEAVVQYAAKAVAVVGSHPSNPDSCVTDLIESLVQPELTSKGDLLVLGGLVARLTLRGRVVSVLPRVLDVILAALANPKLYETALEAVSQLAMLGSLSLPEALGFWTAAVAVIEPRVRKLDEKSTLTWAYLAIAQPEASESPFESVLYSTHVSKQVEYLFTSGEAFAIVAAGWDAKILAQKTDIQGKPALVPSRGTRLPLILLLVMKACLETKPALRKAGCIWLLSLVQYCGHLPAVQLKAADIHLVFMRFLADRDELVQESASRGLSIVYEMGDAELKDTLVRGLLKSFTDSTTSSFTSGSVSHDTELFEPGVMNTNDGSVSTYKDILNLASEVGDPSLVYKFMSLAKNSALWSSRKGIAFGLGSILSKSALDDLLVKDSRLSSRLIPKLYRYRFDPNTSVAKSMGDIWNLLIADSTRAVTDNYEEILADLLKSMGHKEWRVRQAATAALIELLQTVPLETYEPQLEEIWQMGFRAIDDIKESVRKEGNRLTRSLTTTLVRSIDVDHGASQLRASSVLGKLIPFLLGGKGLLGDAEEVRNFALETILKLCTKTGSAIKPFIPTLLEQMVVLMSTLEPQIVNYLALNADKYNVRASDLDAKRLQSVGHSPIIEAMERLLDLVDDSTMEQVVPAVVSAIKRSIGLPSKAAGSRIMATLVLKHHMLTKPYGDVLLKTAIGQIGDRNDTIASSYATAAGYLCRIASVDLTLRLAKKLQTMYFEGDDRTRMVAGIASEAVSKYSGDRFASLAAAFLPLAYIAKNDPEEGVSEPFSREWADNTSGNGAIRLYLSEITELIQANLTSQLYLIRKVVSQAIAGVCAAFSDSSVDVASVGEKNMAQLFTVLLEACKGRSWAGKEHVLDALVSLAIKFQAYVEIQPALGEAIARTVLVEAKRKNRAYAKHAIKSLGRYLGVYQDEVDEYIEIVTAALDDEYYEDESDDEETKPSNKSSQRNLLREEERLELVRSLVAAFAVSPHGDIHAELFVVVLQSLTKIFASSLVIPTWKSELVAVEGLHAVAQRVLSQSQHVELTPKHVETFVTTWKQLLEVAGRDKDIENVRVQFYKATAAWLRLFASELCLVDAAAFEAVVRDTVGDAMANETSNLVRHELEKIQEWQTE
ncbi:hypothetical protein BABINDRAFT_161989 [Babjeviella inositovora NRRL Y-12698]|uniref:TATA-binding protein interacting (TIP20) domain-containing protein n=1 Tax=Babjeviella inositovora NRRL Y-12698 TaxID=984486 RepID=A0A1E3QPH2_9ASCO|nr:uncharacterized protein BABINDRAFT_161989 [Babjeviella inositovora NRRL Y-12698]ODQ79609.1 hypothetical protein BABINDRAFT_161989 [Babjeviella inositovora NRRL Y-12698]